MISNSIRVFLIDDHIVARNGVKLMLGTAKNIEVTGEAETAEEALKIIRTHDFDVVLLDIALPDKSGLQLLKELRREYPKLIILVLSMYPEDIYAVRAIKQGAAGYLTKNSSTETLVSAVQKVAGGGKYITSCLAEKLAKIFDHNINTHSFDTFSDREMEVLRRLASGETVVKIAESLQLTPSTVTTYRARVLQKTGLKNNIELARYAQEQGLLN